MLNGELAVPCSPKPAHAGLIGNTRAVRTGYNPGGAVTTKAGSGDGSRRESRQDRKVATVCGVTTGHEVAWPESPSSEPPVRWHEVACTAGYDSSQRKQ